MDCETCGTPMGESGLCPRCLLVVGIGGQPKRRRWRRAVVPVVALVAGGLGFVAGSASSGPEPVAVAADCPTPDRGRAVVSMAAVRAEAARNQAVAEQARERAASAEAMAAARIGRPQRTEARAEVEALERAARELVAHVPMVAEPAVEPLVVEPEPKPEPEVVHVPMDPELCELLAAQGTESAALASLRCADRAMADYHQWSGRELIDNLYQLHRLKSEVAYALWRETGNGGHLDLAREAALAWLAYAGQVRQDASRAMELCFETQDDLSRCNVNSL